MAPHKKILFLGRTDHDTGYNSCVELAKKNNWELITKQNINNVSAEMQSVDYVFAGGYLVALEAFKNKKIVLAAYDNPVKQDYWLMHPMAKYIGLNGKVPGKYSEEAFVWANKKTWEKLADQYEELWQK